MITRVMFICKMQTHLTVNFLSVFYVRKKLHTPVIICPNTCVTLRGNLQ